MCFFLHFWFLSDKTSLHFPKATLLRRNLYVDIDVCLPAFPVSFSLNFWITFNELTFFATSNFSTTTFFLRKLYVDVDSDGGFPVVSMCFIVNFCFLYDVSSSHFSTAMLLRRKSCLDVCLPAFPVSFSLNFWITWCQRLPIFPQQCGFDVNRIPEFCESLIFFEPLPLQLYAVDEIALLLA